MGELKTLERHFEINWPLTSLVSLNEWLEKKSGFLVSKLVDRGEQERKKNQIRDLIFKHSKICIPHLMFYFFFQQVVTIMSRTLHDLVLGELQQLTTKSQRDDRFDTYMKKTYNKTASLMANSCQAVAQMASTASNTGLALLKGTKKVIFRPY